MGVYFDASFLISLFVCLFPFRPITEENVGRKMLEKMGWKEGEGLGREGAGRLEPVRIYAFHDKDPVIDWDSCGPVGSWHLIMTPITFAPVISFIRAIFN